MKRPFKTKCYLIDRNIEALDLGITQKGEEARLTLDLEEVESFREIMNEKGEEIDGNKCLVSMKSEDSYIIGMGYDEFDSKMKTL